MTRHLPLTLLLVVLLLVVPVGADTSIFSPTTDGDAERTSNNSTFPNLISGVGTGRDIGMATFSATYLSTASTTQTDRFYRHRYGIIVTDTSSLPDSAILGCVTLSITNYTSRVNFGEFSIVVTNGSVSSFTIVSIDDYQKHGITELSARKSSTDLALIGNTTLIFNSNGLNEVSKTNYTVLFVQSGDGIDGVFTGAWASNKESHSIPC